MSNDNQDQKDSAPSYITAEQLNSAITARFRSFETKQTESFSKLESLLAERLSAPKADEPAATKQVVKIDPMIEALKNQVALMQQKDARTREAVLKSRVESELVSAGVATYMIKPLSAQFAMEKTVSYAADDSDEIVFKSGESIYTLKDGVGAFLSATESKAFLAPKPMAGSGDQKYSSNQSQLPKQKLSQEDAGAALFGLIKE